MIDLSLEEMMDLARQSELQKRVEADGVKPPKPEPVTMPEDLRGKLEEGGEAEGHDAPSDPSLSGHRG